MFYGLDDFLVEHEVLDVAAWNEYALVALEASSLADGVEAFDFLVCSTDCLNLSLLVDGARDCEVLFDRQLRQR